MPGAARYPYSPQGARWWRARSSHDPPQGWPRSPPRPRADNLPLSVAGASWRDGPAAIAYDMIPPGLGPTASPPWPPVIILRDRHGGLRLTRNPPCLDRLPVGSERCGFRLLHAGLRLSLLLRQWTRMHDDKAQFLMCDPPIAVFHLDVAVHALAMPAARRF